MTSKKHDCGSPLPNYKQNCVPRLRMSRLHREKTYNTQGFHRTSDYHALDGARRNNIEAFSATEMGHKNTWRKFHQYSSKTFGASDSKAFSHNDCFNLLMFVQSRSSISADAEFTKSTILQISAKAFITDFYKGAGYV